MEAAGQITKLLLDATGYTTGGVDATSKDVIDRNLTVDEMISKHGQTPVHNLLLALQSTKRTFELDMVSTIPLMLNVFNALRPGIC